MQFISRTGWNDKDYANDKAKALRKKGISVKVVKRGDFYYLVMSK